MVGCLLHVAGTLVSKGEGSDGGVAFPDSDAGSEVSLSGRRDPVLDRTVEPSGSDVAPSGSVAGSGLALGGGGPVVMWSLSLLAGGGGAGLRTYRRGGLAGAVRINWINYDLKC